MASVSKGARQKAVIGASQAMLGSLGFFVKESLLVTKESADLARGAAGTATKLNNTLLAYLELEQRVPESVKVDPREDLDKAVVRIKKRSFDLATLGFIIPLLLNKQARDYLSSFAAGLIGVDNVEKFKLGLIAVTGVLTGVFTYKIIKQVGDSIEAVKKLSQVVGTLFGITEAASSDIDLENKKIDDEKKKILDEEKKKKLEEKKAKDAVSKGRESVKGSKKEYKKANLLGKIKFLATKFGPKVLGAVVKSIPFVGAFVTIGLLIADIAGFFIDEEEKDEEKESVIETKPAVSGLSSAPLPGQSAQEVVKTMQAEKPATAATASASKPPEKQAPVQSADTSSVPPAKPAESPVSEVKGAIAVTAAIPVSNSRAAQAESSPLGALQFLKSLGILPKGQGGKDGFVGYQDDQPISKEEVTKKITAAGKNPDKVLQLLSEFGKPGPKVDVSSGDFNRTTGGAFSGESVVKDSEEVVGKKKQAGSKILIVNNIDNKVVTAASKE